MPKQWLKLLRHHFHRPFRFGARRGSDNRGSCTVPVNLALIVGGRGKPAMNPFVQIDQSFRPNLIRSSDKQKKSNKNVGEFRRFRQQTATMFAAKQAFLHLIDFLADILHRMQKLFSNFYVCPGRGQSVGSPCVQISMDHLEKIGDEPGKIC